MWCRGIRGATQVDANTSEAILAGTKELLQRMVDSNQIDKESVACVLLTATPDLNAEFPALAARQLGWTDVALMCGQEMGVPHGLPRCIRILILYNTDKRPEEITHVYIRGAEGLREDAGK